jgi:hypothetical protein
MVFEYLEPIAGVFAYKNGIAMDEGSVWVCELLLSLIHNADDGVTCAVHIDVFL